MQKPLFFLIVTLLLSYLIGSILAYPLFEYFNNPLEHPFHKLARHCTLLCGLIFSFLLLRFLKLNKDKVFGFNIGIRNFLNQLLAGFLIGIFILIIVESLLLLCSIHIFDQSYNFSIENILKLVLKGLITGLIVGLLEEILFRGTIYKSIEKDYSAITVIIITALIYSAVHFIKYPVVNDTTNITWLTGPTLLPEAFASLFTLEIWDTFLTLFLLGILLAIFRARYSTIAYCIGIHAGIVMMLKVSRKLTNYNPETQLEFLVNNTDRQMGILAAMVLGSFCIYFYYILLVKNK